jgi:hypothetical protein
MVMKVRKGNLEVGIFPLLRENFTNFQDALETRCNFNPSIVETDEWAHLPYF